MTAMTAKIRRLVRAGCLGVALVVAAACGAQESATEEGGLETSTVSIGLGLDPGLAPQMVAIEKGFLEEEGFTEVNTSTYEAGALAGEALAAGEIDLWGPSNLPVISMRHNGVPVVVAGTAATGWSEKLLARADAEIQDPEDLTRIRIGSLTGATSNIVNNLAQANGLDPADLQTVNLTPPEQLVALANDEVQAIVVWNPWPAQFQEQHPDVAVEILWEQNTSYFPWSAGEELAASNSRMLFVLREDYIANRPNAAGALMNAMFRAQEWLEDPANSDEAKAIFGEYTDYPGSIIDEIWGDYVFSPALDADYLQDMTAYTDYLGEAGVISDSQDPASYTYTGFLERHDSSLVDVDGAWQP